MKETDVIRNIKNIWTDEQIERLKDLAASGASAFRIAAALNRSIVGVRSQAKKLGIDLPTLREIRAKTRDANQDAR